MRQCERRSFIVREYFRTQPHLSTQNASQAKQSDIWGGYQPLAPNSAERRLAAACTCLARVFSTSSVIRHIGPEIPSAPITSPVKLNTGTATQRTSELNSPSSMANALRRTSAISRNSTAGSVIDFLVDGLNSTRSRKRFN